MFIDAHAHLDPNYFETGPDPVLQAAFEAGVEQLIVVGCGVESSRFAVELARAYPGRVFAAVGVHPHDVAKMREGDFEAIAALARAPEVVAVGETGLDYHYRHSPPEAQQEAFRRFIALANEVDKPVVVHTREAEADTLEILRRERPQAGVQLHCFTGSRALAEGSLDLGAYISLSGVVTFNNAEALRAIARDLPLERILVETDCPYLTPAPFRGRQNTPSYVTVTAGRIAALRGMAIEAFARHAASNTRRLFRLPEAAQDEVLAFATGSEVYAAVHREDADAVVKALKRWPRKKLRGVRLWTPEGSSTVASTMQAVRAWAQGEGLPCDGP